MPFSSGIIIVLILILLFVLFSGFISGSKAAFLSLPSFEKEKPGNKDNIIKELLGRHDYLFATFLILNTFSNLSTVILGVYAFNSIFNFNNHPILGFWCAFFLFSFIILLFGEIIPQIYGQNHALKLAQQGATGLKILERLCRPFSSLIVSATNVVNKSFNKKNPDVSVEELSKALHLSSNEMSEEKEMLEGIINLYSKTAVEIMTPRLDIADICIKSNFKQVLDYVINTGYSRIPVYSGNQDNIKGVLYIKDLLPYLGKPETFRWQSLVRSPFFVPETKKIDDLLEEFRTNKIHFAIVVDEFGGTSGIVTLEDILEEIVGEIDDEYDEETSKYKKMDDGSFIFEAKIPLPEFFKISGVDAKEFEKQTEDVDTLAGLVLELKGDFPQQNEIITYDSYQFEVCDIHERRIQKVKFSRLLLFFCILLFFGCSNNPTPKPYGYFRVDLPDHQYKSMSQYPEFYFDISTNAITEEVPDTAIIKGRWFNIYYPGLSGKIYCTYMPITHSQLNEISEDSRKLVYRHVMKTNRISEKIYSNPQNKIYGILYELDGNVATPLQIILTDSTSHFFRASLLFDTEPNRDSIAPVLDYIKKDVEHLIESFRWKDN